MNLSFASLLTAGFLLTSLTACGSGDDLDFSTRFTGSLSERSVAATSGQKADSSVTGTVCVIDQCGDTDANGNFNFKAYGNITSGRVLVSVRFVDVTLEASADLANNADEVRLALSVDNGHRNLLIDALEVLKTR